TTFAVDLSKYPIEDSPVEIKTSQMVVTTVFDNIHFAFVQPNYRDVEGTATKIIDKMVAFYRIIRKVGRGCSYGLLKQRNSVQTGQARSLVCRRALGLHEHSRNSNYNFLDFLVC